MHVSWRYHLVTAREHGNLDVPDDYGTLDPGSNYTFQELRPVIALGTR